MARDCLAAYGRRAGKNGPQPFDALKPGGLLGRHSRCLHRDLAALYRAGIANLDLVGHAMASKKPDTSKSLPPIRVQEMTDSALAQHADLLQPISLSSPEFG